MIEKDIFEDVIESGKRRGFITYSDIVESIPAEFLTEEEFEEVIEIIQNMGVRVIESEEAGSDEEEVTDGREGYEGSQDLIAVYFQSMGDIPVLTKDEERDLARRIKEGKDIVSKIVKRMPLHRKLTAGLDSQNPEEDRGKEEALRQSLERLDEIMRYLILLASGDEMVAQSDGKSKRDPMRKCMGYDYRQIESEVGMKIDELGMQYERIMKARELMSVAKNALIKHNLRLVVNIAKHYIGKGLSLLDLIQEGNIGLMKAIDKFDYTRGFKFSTYATWWVRQAMTRALLEQTKTIRVPIHMMELYNKVRKISKELAQQMGREPGKEEIAEHLNIPVKKVVEALSAVQDPVNLNAPVGDEDGTVEDFIGDSRLSPYVEAEQAKITEQITNILHTLSPREEQVIKMRFGIGMNSDHTLEEIGRDLAITRERVRQIESKAMRKLKHPKRIRMLRRLNTD